jgi:glycosyltransferase involved in cell wall biosynthesis
LRELTERVEMNKNIRNILYIDATAQIGGAETNLLAILRDLNRSDFNPCAVLCPREGPLLDESRKMGMKGVAVRYHSYWSKKPYLFLKTMRELTRLVTSNEVDIIHLNHQFLINFSVLTSFFTRRPLICHCRGIEGDRFMNRYKRWFNKATRIIAVSHAAAANLAEYGVRPEKIQVIHDGIDVSRFNGSARSNVLRREYSFSDDDFVIGYVGRPEPEKGLEDLLVAAREVCMREKNVRLAVVGEPMLPGRDYIGELKQLASHLGLNGKVVFTGFRDDVPEVYRDLDLMVLPTWRDAFPNVLLEAMASRVPVIATNVGGIPEIVKNGETGTLIEPKDIQGLTKAIVSSIRMDDRRKERIISRAEEKVRTHFTLERQVREIEKVYSQVADGISLRAAPIRSAKLRTCGQ